MKNISESYYSIPSSVRKLFLLTYHDAINRELGPDIRTVLDVGCGEGNSIEKIDKAKELYLVGIDAYLPYLKTAKKRKVYDKLIHTDIRKLKVKDKSFDAVLLISVIEHLSKKDGISILNKLEKIAKKRIIILTPSGYLQQDSFDKNPYQEHKSGNWTNELIRRGYNIRGMDGFNFPIKRLKYNPILTLITQPFIYFLPKYATSIIAIKRLQSETS